MHIDPQAPVIARDQVLINAPLELVWRIQTDVSAWPTWRPEVTQARADGPLAVGSVFYWEEGDGPLAVGSVFYWEEGGLQIVSTIGELDAPHRVAWTGPAQGIEAVHVWELTSTAAGVLVHTEESWRGEPVQARATQLQPLLDHALRTWLGHLKAHSEASAQALEA
jgi:uncharacterized protein YndB with AHSA1/START domain